MAIEFRCACGKQYKVDDKYAGRSSTCKACGATLQIPDPAVDEYAEPTLIDIVDDDADNAASPSVTPSAKGDVFTRMVVDTSTSASNPGRMKIDLVRYSLNYPLPLVFTVLGLVLAVISLFRDLPLAVGPAVAAITLYLWAKHLLTQRAKFLTGDTCAAMIVNESPWLVAVYTDLRADRGPAKPCVRIVKVPMGRMALGPPQVGKRVAAGALYSGPPIDGAWQMFDPTIAHLVNSDGPALERMMATISKGEWRSLDTAIERIDTTKSGAYFLWKGNKRIPNHSPLQTAVVTLVGVAMLIVLLFGKPKEVPMSAGGPGQFPTTPAKPTQSAARPVPAAPKPVAAAIAPKPSTPTTTPNAVASAAPAVATTPPTTAPTAAPTITPTPAVAPTPTPAPERPAIASNRPGNSDARNRVRGERIQGKLGAGETAAPPNARLVEIQWGSTWYYGFVRKTEGNRFFIHYNGWSDHNDEWVEADRLRDSK